MRELRSIRTLALMIGCRPGAIMTTPGIANVRRLLVDCWQSELPQLVDCSALGGLEHLRLQRVQLRPDQWQRLFGQLGSLRTLQTLILPADGFEAALAAPELGGLEHLAFCSLRHRPASSAGWPALFRRPLFANLQSLAFLAVDRLPASFVSDLLAHCSPRLTRLDLAALKLGNKGAAALAESPRLAQIKRLSLVACQIGDAGVRALARSPRVQGLTHLDLSGNNNIGQRGCQELAKSTALRSLRRLKLEGVDVGSSRPALARFNVQLSTPAELARQAEVHRDIKEMTQTMREFRDALRGWVLPTMDE